MLTVSLYVELLRTHPRLVFWFAALAQAVLWTLVPALFYAAPPGDVADVIAIGKNFHFGSERGPPLAYWLAEIAFRIGGLTGVYVLSQLCILIAFWAVFTLGSLIVGATHATLAVLLMAGITALSIPTPDFGPAILSVPLWALALLHCWRAVGMQQRAYWYVLAVDIGLLLLTTYLGVILLLSIVAFAASTARGQAQFRTTVHPWIAGILTVGLLFPHLMWIDQASGGMVPHLGQALAPQSLGRNAQAGLRLLAIFVLSHAGLAVLVAIAANMTRMRRAQAVPIAREPADPLARRFVYFFALAPALAVIAAAFAGGTSAPSATSALTVLSGLAVVMAAGDVVRLHHQRIAGFAWATLLLVPPALAAGAVALLPWTLAIDMRITQPAAEMTRFFSETFERRTGRPLKIVAGDTRLASLIALLAPGRPALFVDDGPGGAVTRGEIAEHGAIVVWPATDATGTPPAAIKALFPDMVVELPRAFERPIQGRLPLFRVGWAMLRPAAAPPAANDAQ